MSESVDWRELWREFGFDTPDAIGATYASRTQLVTALQSSSKNRVPSPLSSIHEAIENGTLRRLTARDEDGIEVTRGYQLAGEQV